MFIIWNWASLAGKVILKEDNTFNHPIVIFDGDCNLCNSTVNFIIKHDKKNLFRFTTLQSESGSSILKHFGLKEKEFDTVVLLFNGTVYLRSEAVILILKMLGFPWSMMGIFGILSKKKLDYIYVIISTNRYSWFGKRDTCIIPNESVKSRFI